MTEKNNELSQELHIIRIQMIGVIIMLIICAAVIEFEPFATAAGFILVIASTAKVLWDFIRGLWMLIKATWNSCQTIKTLRSESEKHFPMPGTRKFRQQANRIRHLPNKNLTKKRISHTAQHSLAKILKL